MQSVRTPRIALLVAAALLAAVAVAGASSLNGGTVELRARGAFLHQSFESGDDFERTTNAFLLNADMGYFLTGMVELVGGVIYERSVAEVTAGDNETKDTDSRIGLLGQLILNFPTSGRMVPFVGGGAGFLDRSSEFESITGDYSTEGDYETILILPRVEGGIRVLVGDSASLNIAAFYEHRKNAEGIEDAETDNIGVNLGISIFPVRK